MMWKHIAKLPTVSTDANEHESITRAYQILNKIKDYLKRGCPYDIILELIDEAEEELQ
jgi:hypothetical protein